jgi:hypothetical protein
MPGDVLWRAAQPQQPPRANKHNIPAAAAVAAGGAGVVACG